MSMQSVINFFNKNNGFSMAILTTALVIVTFYYARLTKKMTINSTLSIEQTKAIIENRKDEHINTKNNYLMLLNSEIYMNSMFYVMGIHYLSGEESNKFAERIKRLFRDDTATSNYRVIKAYISEYTKTEIWNDIKSDCAKHLSYDLMEELVGYYAGVQHLKMFSIDEMSNEDYIEFAKGQLISTMKCFDLLDKQGIKLRRSVTYDVENKIFRIDRKSGSLITDT